MEQSKTSSVGLLFWCLLTPLPHLKILSSSRSSDIHGSAEIVFGLSVLSELLLGAPYKAALSPDLEALIIPFRQGYNVMGPPGFAWKPLRHFVSPLLFKQKCMLSLLQWFRMVFTGLLRPPHQRFFHQPITDLPTRLSL